MRQLEDAGEAARVQVHAPWYDTETGEALDENEVKEAMAKEMASFERFKVKVDSSYVEFKMLERSGQHQGVGEDWLGASQKEKERNLHCKSQMHSYPG